MADLGEGLPSVVGIQPATLDRLHAQAALQVRQRADGRIHYEYEIKLQQKEMLADAVLVKVRNQKPITVAEKETLARYIGLMMRRVSRRDDDTAIM